MRVMPDCKEGNVTFWAGYSLTSESPGYLATGGEQWV